MIRSPLGLLLLVLLLWPSPAAAGPRPVEFGRASLDPVAPAYGHELARSTGGMGLLQALESRFAGGADRLPTQKLSSSGSAGVRADTRTLRSLARVTAVEAIAPVCERLPYFATAPPLSR